MQLLLIALTLFHPTFEPVKDPKPVSVYVFLACECPISQKYVPILNSIYTEYKDAPGFTWSFVVPGKVKKSEIQGFVEEFGVRFPIESGSRVVRQLNATTTPQVIIVKGVDNHRDHGGSAHRGTESIVYSGAIDNWFYELGKYRREATENYLVDALNALKEGREPAVRETEAIGCPIASSN